jgi:hypothetical protein
VRRGQGGEAKVDFGAATSNYTVDCALDERRAIVGRVLAPGSGAQLSYFF